MQQIDWSKAPDDATHAGYSCETSYWYKNVTLKNYEYWINKSNVGWRPNQGKPVSRELTERPVASSKTPDKDNLIATMKKRPIDSWSAGDCAVLPHNWVWVAAYGMHPHYDTLVRSSDGAAVKFTDVYGFVGAFAPPAPPALPRNITSAIDTLERLGYEWKGGELWKPPIGKTPDLIEYDGWKVGDECWISNEAGYGITDYNRELLGFDTMSTIVSLFVTPKGTKMATVSHISGDCICWKLDMLKRPIPQCDFEHGKNVYLKHVNTCVGRYVGINPDTNGVVTVVDDKFRSYLLRQVTQ